MATTRVGPLVKEWRVRRRRSQMDLALEIGVSPRHLSFVETGRSRPSPELVLALAEGLDVPLRERNSLLLAAGYAPRYTETSLEDPVMQRTRAALERLLAAHDPYPGVVIDRRWDVVLANPAATLLLEGVPAELLAPAPNVFRLSLHPDAMAGRIRNFRVLATYLLTQLHRLVVITNDPALRALEEEVSAYPNVQALGGRVVTTGWDEPPILVPYELEVGGRVLSMFTTLTTFGTAQDVTLAELTVELFFPADDATDEVLRGR